MDNQLASQTNATRYVQAEKPLYILNQNQKRLLIPKITLFIVLGFIFYLGVLLNVSLTNLSAKTETIVKLTALFVLGATVLLGVIVNIKKAKQTYNFHHKYISFQKKNIALASISDIQAKTNFLDKIFKTHSLTLIGQNEKFKISNIPNSISLADYIRKLISYSRGF